MSTKMPIYLLVSSVTIISTIKPDTKASDFSAECTLSCNFDFFQEAPVTGRKADVIKAAHLCAEAALRLVKPGNQVSTYFTTKVANS